MYYAYMERFKASIDNLSLIKRDYSLHAASAMGFGGIAEFYSEPRNINELMEVLEGAYKLNIPVSVLGAGTHTLISDTFVEGIVISTKLLKGVTMKGTLLECLPGEMFESVIDKAIEHQLIGMEKLAGIPGTIAGAIMKNRSANGSSISDFVYFIDIITFSGKLIRTPIYHDTFSSQELKMPEPGIITNIALRLKASKATAEAKIRKGMYIEFMFIPPATRFLSQIFKDRKDMSASRILRTLGMDRLEGKAEFSRYQGNCIFAYPDCTANDVNSLIQLAEKKAKREMRIDLERSISYLGEFN